MKSILEGVSGVYIIGGYNYIAEDEKTQNEAKFAAWFDDFMKRYEAYENESGK